MHVWASVWYAGWMFNRSLPLIWWLKGYWEILSRFLDFCNPYCLTNIPSETIRLDSCPFQRFVWNVWFYELVFGSTDLFSSIFNCVETVSFTDFLPQILTSQGSLLCCLSNQDHSLVWILLYFYQKSLKTTLNTCHFPPYKLMFISHWNDTDEIDLNKKRIYNTWHPKWKCFHYLL